MNAERLACAPSGKTWPNINWAEVQRQVRGLQACIVKATLESCSNWQHSGKTGCRKVPL